MTTVVTTSMTFANANGVAAIPFAFQSITASEVGVLRAGIDQLGTFTVALNGDGTGSVTPLASWGTDAVIVYSKPSFQQLSNFSRFGAFYPDQMNDPLDRLARTIIALNTTVSGAVRAPVGEVLLALPPLAARRNTVLQFDDNGNPTGAANIGKGDPGGNVSAIGLFSIANTLSIPAGTSVVRTSGYSSLENGIADYVADAAVDAAYVIANPRTSFISSNARGFRLARNQIVSPEMFGALGDGASDDYAAFQAMVGWINARGGGAMRWGRGKTYFMGQHIVAGNGIADLNFSNCVGLMLDGNGSKLDFQGNFDRAVSTTRALALMFSGCSEVTIANLEIDGNVDLMTNTSLSAEPASYGIALLASVDVVIDNVYLHHHSSDGIYIKDNGSNGANRTASRRVTLNNVRSCYNARQGMSVVQCRNLLAKNSTFSFTARSTGTYGTHSPGGGVDIEPNRSTATVAPDTMDVDTGNITFENCTFEENGGSQFLCGGTLFYDNVKFSRCTFKTGGGSTFGGDTIILGASGLIMEDCDVDFGAAGSTKAFYVWPNAANIAGDMIFRGNRFVGVAQMLRTNGAPTGRITIDGNIFKAVSAVPYVGATLLNLGSGTDIHFLNNRVFVPKEMYTDGGTGDRHIIFTFSAVSVSRNNVFITDLLAAAGSSGTAHYANGYNATTIVENDRYIGTAVGTIDTFRPVFNGAFNTTFPYSANRGLAVSSGQLGFAVGAGNSIVQATSKATGVALDNSTGQITLNAAALAAATVVSFTFTNNKIEAHDELAVWIKSGLATPGTYRVWAEGNAAGSRTIVVENRSAGSLSEALVLGFMVRKGSIT